MENLPFIFQPGFWTREIQAGAVTFSPLSLGLGIVVLITILAVQQAIKRILRDRIFPRFRIAEGIASAYATLVGYIIMALGLFIAISLTFEGLNWTTISVVLGGLSVGIGFGLQNVADNFISGLIILFERPIKVGDRIQIGDIDGDVVDIKARCTMVKTNNNIEIIVPNSEFISQQVINWSRSDRRIRFKIPVGVHYQSDVREVERALIEAAQACPDVLDTPAPSAKFMEFGDSSLNFELWVWTESMINRPRAFKSAINFLIWDSLKQHGIEIPFPQRDIYVKEFPKPAAEQD